MGRAAAAAAAWLLAACGAATEPIIGVDAVEVPACTQAAENVHVATPRCVGAAALVACSRDEVCISDNPHACDGNSRGCVDLCAGSGAYAVACDDRALPSAVPAAGLGCQAMRVAANGTQYYCCPCSP
jgi:hypothetical protein